MSTPSDPQSPPDPARRPQASTQEIPVVRPAGATAQPLPPHPGATPPGAVQPTAEAVAAPQPTGPVDFVPGLPGAGTPPPPSTSAQPSTSPHPAAPAPEAARPTTTWPGTLEDDLLSADRPKESRPRRRLDRTALAGLGLAALSVVLLEIGLILDFGSESFWSAVTLWSAFATVAALLSLLAFAAFYPAGDRRRSGPAWRVAAGGLVGLAVFWLLVVLPVVASDRGFVLTAALGCLGVALWIGPRRKD